MLRRHLGEAMALADHLHNEIDTQEAIRAKVSERIAALRARVPELVQAHGLDMIFEMLAALNADEMADETTDAARMGFVAAKKRMRG